MDASWQYPSLSVKNFYRQFSQERKTFQLIVNQQQQSKIRSLEKEESEQF